MLEDALNPKKGLGSSLQVYIHYQYKLYVMIHATRQLQADDDLISYIHKQNWGEEKYFGSSYGLYFVSTTYNLGRSMARRPFDSFWG